MSLSKIKAFTLIELLVVIAIIAMLMSILVPVVGTARESGKRSKCLSNLKQLATGWLGYHDDNDYTMVSAYTSKRTDWVYDGDANSPSSTLGNTEDAIKKGMLYRYAQDVKLFKCPTDRSAQMRSYSICYNMNGEKSKANGDNSEAHTSLTQIKKPTEKLLMLDEVDWKSNVGWNVDSWRLGPDGIAFLDPIVSYHSKGCNMVFADTHAEHHKWEKKDTVNFSKQLPYDPFVVDDLLWLQRATDNLK